MNKVKRILLTVLETAGICSIVLVSVLPVSCKVSTQGIHVIGGNYKVPQLVEVSVVDGKHILLGFSDHIRIDKLIVSPFLEGISDSYDVSETCDLSPSLASAAGKYGTIECSAVCKEDSNTVQIILENETQVGKKYEIYGEVRDKTGNTLTFCVPFTGFNSRIPAIIMTEIHPAMAGIQKTEDAGGTRRLEYVECLALEDGNLAGLEFCSGYAGESKAYVFPPVEVKKNEIFVLHLRTWGEGCISEEAENLNLAFSRYCGPYRDLWNPGTSKPVNEKNDVLVIREITSGKLVDAFMYSDSSIEQWSDYLKTDFTSCSDFKNFYESNDVSAAFNSAGVGTTKVFSRSSGDGRWSITSPDPGSL